MIELDPPDPALLLRGMWSWQFQPSKHALVSLVSRREAYLGHPASSHLLSRQMTLYHLGDSKGFRSCESGIGDKDHIVRFYYISVISYYLWKDPSSYGIDRDQWNISHVMIHFTNVSSFYDVRVVCITTIHCLHMVDDEKIFIERTRKWMNVIFMQAMCCWA